MPDRTVERIMLFCKYPRPGAVKTRLAQVLGKQGAARLQLDMGRHILGWMRETSRRRGSHIELRYTGETGDAMRELFGAGVGYEEQGPGDLGAKLHRAFASGFARGAGRVVAVGADCPTVDADVMAQALDALGSHDVVIGPARDGGYYLIGMTQLFAPLFKGIDWGTAAVKDQTLERARRQGLSVCLLEPMDDVDRPEDLCVWDLAKSSPAPGPRRK